MADMSNPASNIIDVRDVKKVSVLLNQDISPDSNDECIAFVFLASQGEKCSGMQV
jgi:hypothetical protein